jgi:hypothetical protein
VSQRVGRQAFLAVMRNLRHGVDQISDFRFQISEVVSRR